MKKPYFIGIAGGSASRKSTICTILESKYSHHNSWFYIFHKCCTYPTTYYKSNHSNKIIFSNRCFIYSDSNHYIFYSPSPNSYLNSNIEKLCNYSKSITWNFYLQSISFTKPLPLFVV